MLDPIPLLERLRNCAEQWCGAQADGASLSRLGRLVANDGGFFSRIEGGGTSTTTATLEKFARFLIAPANWPRGEVPPEAIAFGHVVGLSDPTIAESPDNCAAAIGGGPPANGPLPVSDAGGAQTPASGILPFATVGG